MSDAANDPFPDHGDLESATGFNLCDFCSPPGTAVWGYPCKSFRVVDGLNDLYVATYGRDGWSNGDWGACERCSTLIEEGKWARLATLAAHPWQMAMLERFQENQTGPRYRDERGPAVNTGLIVTPH